MSYIESKGGLTLQEKSASIYPNTNNRVFTPSSGYDGMSRFIINAYRPPLYDYLFTKNNIQTIFSNGTFKNGYDFGVYLYYRGSTDNTVTIENGLIRVHQKYNSSEYSGFCLNKKVPITSTSRLLVVASQWNSATDSYVEGGSNNHTSEMNWIGLASACSGDKNWYYMDSTNTNFTPIKTGQADVSTACAQYRTEATGYYNYDSKPYRMYDIPLQTYRNQLNSSSTATSLYVYMGGHSYDSVGDYYIKYIGLVDDKNSADLMTPDATYAANVSSSGSATISVSRKPRFIVCATMERGSNYRCQQIILDVENQVAKRSGFYGSSVAYHNWEDLAWSSATTYFTTISASSVVYAGSAFGVNQRVMIEVYY